MGEIKLLERVTNPPTPSAGIWDLYFKSDGLYFMDDTGLVIGPFTLSGASPNATELTINTDAITVTQRSHKLQPQSGTADNLSTINGAVAGQSGILYVSDFGTDTITIKHNVGNILCVGDADIILSNGCVFWYSNGTKIFCSGGGGGGAPFIDSTAIIKGSADATKLLRIEVDGFTTATTRVLTPPNYDGTIATLAGTETFTNKRITLRPVSVAFNATPTWNTDNGDVFVFSGLSGAITNLSTNMTGTPTDWEMKKLRFCDDGTARTITFGTPFINGPATLPTGTVSGKWLNVNVEWNPTLTKWVCMANGSNP